MRYLNNPLNIRFDARNNWAGLYYRCGHNGFCLFKEFKYCYRAAVKILQSYRKRGIKTLSQIISTWAPPSENNTNAYISYIIKQLPYLHKDSVILESDYPDLLSVMSFYESHYKISSEEVSRLLDESLLEFK